MPRRQKESYSIQSVDNALDLLEVLCEVEDEVRISQLSEQLGMNKTSVFRLLATFENRGYVEKDARNGKYRLGLATYEMGQKALARMRLLRTAKPAMEKLARASNEATYLAIPRAAECLLLDMVDTLQQVKIISLLGRRFPLTGPSAGLMILACRPSLLKHYREDSSAGRKEQLPTIAQQGYAVDRGGFGEGTASLSVPLFNGQEQVLGSLCLAGPDFRFTEDKIHQVLLPQLREAGIVISSKLGYLGHFTSQRR